MKKSSFEFKDALDQAHCGMYLESKLTKEEKPNKSIVELFFNYHGHIILSHFCQSEIKDPDLMRVCEILTLDFGKPENPREYWILQKSAKVWMAIKKCIIILRVSTMKRHFVWILVGLMLGSLSDISLISPAEEKWIRKADMPTKRSGLSTSVVGGKIYAIGGFTDRFAEPLSTVEEYDPRTDKWTKKTDMPTARGFLSTSVVNGKIYAIGGVGGGKHLPTVEEYDLRTDKWTKKSIPLFVKGALSTSVVNGKIYAIGSEEKPSVVEEYDPATDKWTRKADIPKPRRALSTGVVNGKIYAIGGVSEAGGDLNKPYLSKVEEYDPATNTWGKKTDMPTARGFLSTSVVNGKIYAIGGIPANGEDALLTIEEYDPRTDAWTKKADMPAVRWFFSAIAVNGKIYVIGGWKEGSLSKVEEYDSGLPESIEAKGKLVTSWGKIKTKY